jgi:hypothetical protein
MSHGSGQRVKKRPDYNVQPTSGLWSIPEAVAQGVKFKAKIPAAKTSPMEPYVTHCITKVRYVKFRNTLRHGREVLRYLRIWASTLGLSDYPNLVPFTLKIRQPFDFYFCRGIKEAVRSRLCDLGCGLRKVWVEQF